MKTILTIVFLSSFLCLYSFSQKADVAIHTAMNDSIVKNTGVIYKLDEAVVEVYSPSEYSEKAHEIYTIYNAKGEEHLRLAYRYNKFFKYKDIEIKVLNALGMEIQKLKKKDFSVRDAYDGITLADDDKIMELTIPSRAYPFTVDLQYETSVNGYIMLPGWVAAANTEIFSYTIKIPAALEIRYRTLNMSEKPSIQTDAKTKTYSWLIKNLTVPEPVEHSYEAGRLNPYIQVIPCDFEYAGYKGQFRTWQDFGKWNYALYEEKKPFTDQRIVEIKSMIPASATKEEKIDILYNYLKTNFRYVSIQLGIGGFKPFAIKYVDENKFGDCKALTNYMRNLLQVAGIKSYPALINAGYNKFPADPGFPSDPFNHVILCIPGEKDSMWLECTSRNNKPGFLGTFTEDKNALLLTENGGVLIHTPKSLSSNNKLNTHSDIWVNEDAGAEVKTYLYATGDIYALFDYYIAQNNNNEQKEFFSKYLNYKPSEAFNVENKKDTGSGLAFNLAFQYEKAYNFKAGNKFFFPQRMSELCNDGLKMKDKRTVHYVFQYPYEKNDTTIYHLPHSFSIDNIPEAIEINNDYGYYKREIIYEKEAGAIKVIARLILKNRIVPPADYEKVAEFFAEVNDDEGQKIVLKKE